MKLFDPLMNSFKPCITLGAGKSCRGWSPGVITIAHVMEKFANHAMTGGVSLCLQFIRQPAQAFACPLQ